MLGGSGEAVGMGSGVGDAVGEGAGFAAVAGVAVKASVAHAAAAKEAASSKRFKCCVLCFSTHGTGRILRVGFGALHQVRQFRNDLERVPHDKQVRELADGHGSVAVDRHDRAGGLHADLVLDRA